MKLETKIDKLLTQIENTDKHDFKKLSELIIQLMRMNLGVKGNSKPLIKSKRFDSCVLKLKYLLLYKTKDIEYVKKGKQSLLFVWYSHFRNWYKKLSKAKQKEYLEAVTKIEEYEKSRKGD